MAAAPDPAVVDYLLDTDHISTLQRQEGAIYERLAPRMARAQQAGAVFAVSAVSLHEQVQGVLNKLGGKRPDRPRWYRQLQELAVFYAESVVLPFDATADDALAKLDATGAARKVGKMDRRIAAVAVANGLPLLTGNRQDFERIPGLKIEDWQTA